MALLTPSFTWDLESNMRLIAENAYNEILAKNWWANVGKETTLRSKRERFTWFLDSAGIDYTGDRFGSSVEFEELATASTEIAYQAATKGFRVNRNQFEDNDGNGVHLATEWSRQQGALFAYWPQQQTASLLKNGTTVLAFDGKALFAVDHPNHVFDSTAGVYCNWFKGSASGVQPGALPIDESVTLDVAVTNLSKAIAQIAQVPTANGQIPRNLRVKKLIVPSKLVTRATLVTDAKFIAGAAASGGGSFDLSGVISRWGIEVVEAPELGAAFGGSDTTYYLIAEQALSSQLGFVVYGVRNAFRILYNDGVTDAQLQVDNGLQWIVRGENTTAPGMPYLGYRVDAT
jgi:phage major head subunit gpT-like protein